MTAGAPSEAGLTAPARDGATACPRGRRCTGQRVFRGLLNAGLSGEGRADLGDDPLLSPGLEIGVHRQAQDLC